MRKGEILLLLAAMAFAGAILLPFSASAANGGAALEETESGAPSAIMMFPLGEKTGPEPSDMAAVGFNHLIHERWLKNTDKDCIVCHHTGDPLPCATCHTVTGSGEGANITLFRAMHAQSVPPRKEDTPSSCVSCHNKQLTQRNCAGCHTTLVKDREAQNDAWCVVCHRATPKMTQAELDAGIAGKLTDAQNLALATETVLARKQANYVSPLKSPYKVVIDELANGKYEPCVFNHRHHVASLLQRIQGNKLAGAFHTQPATLCVTCHHHSPATLNPPKCVTCHSKNINPATPQRPALKAAYHLNCLTCHKDMKVSRPRSTDCTTCHKLRADAGEGGK